MSAQNIPAAATQSKSGRVLSSRDCTHCFAVPGSDSMIDLVHPITGRSCCFDRTLEQVQEWEPGAVVMSVDEYIASKAARQDSPIEWRETTEERYDDMLGVLPPAAWQLGAFLVGEPYDHHAATGQPRFECFVSRRGQYCVSSRPITRAEFATVVSKLRAAL
jgi:hypothetical protein